MQGATPEFYFTPDGAIPRFRIQLASLWEKLPMQWEMRKWIALRVPSPQGLHPQRGG